MEHFPVMLQESVQQLAIKKDGIYLDCTFGRGGHSREILKHLDDSGKLLAFDRDWDAINSKAALALLKDKRFELQQRVFSELEQAVIEKGWAGKVDGILIDLGVSSPQLDDPDRGFSFLREGPLDMRMDDRSGMTAAQWLQQVKEQDLVKVLFEYGEEKFARRIARAIVKARMDEPLETTRQLVQLIERAIPVKDKHKHPATRSFQAIRIELNQELKEIDEVLRQAVKVLNTGGRLVVIAFHSLEDRIVKRFIRDESRGKYRPDRLPVMESDIDHGRLIRIGKAIRAGASEIGQNPRSRSAIMRVAERCR